MFVAVHFVPCSTTPSEEEVEPRLTKFTTSVLLILTWDGRAADKISQHVFISSSRAFKIPCSELQNMFKGFKIVLFVSESSQSGGTKHYKDKIFNVQKE